MGFGPLVLAMVIPFRVIGSPRLSTPDICHQIESTASAESLRGILRGGALAAHHGQGAIPAGSPCTSPCARQPLCINRAAEPWFHNAQSQKKPAVKGAKLLLA